MPIQYTEVIAKFTLDIIHQSNVASDTLSWLEETPFLEMIPH